MFTRNEFLFFWLPGVFLGAIIFSGMVIAGVLNIPAAATLIVLLGILLKFAARKVNPAPAKPESEGEAK